MFSAGTQVPRITSHPASARHLEMAQPKPWSSATPATKAFLPVGARETKRGRGGTSSQSASANRVDDDKSERWFRRNVVSRSGGATDAPMRDFSRARARRRRRAARASTDDARRINRGATGRAFPRRIAPSAMRGNGRVRRRRRERVSRERTAKVDGKTAVRGRRADGHAVHADGRGAPRLAGAGAEHVGGELLGGHGGGHGA